MKPKENDDKSVPALLARIDELSARLQAAETKLLGMPVTSASDAQRMIDEREEWRAEERKEIEETLARGPRQYQVAIEGNPGRLVGAVHEGEAVRKYHAYFGIRSTTKKVDCQEKPCDLAAASK